MPLARFDVPFEHPDWIFEPKMDGFRALAYVEGGACRLVSRNRNAFKTFEPLAQAIAEELTGRSAVLDGEIVRPGPRQSTRETWRVQLAEARAEWRRRHPKPRSETDISGAF
jgi:ATP-dependent DNA ligase